MESDVELATRVAKLAGQLVLELRESFGVVEPDDKARRKQLKDDADRAAHDLIVGELAQHRPGDAVLSEEGIDQAQRADADRVWIVDPLDGTAEYGKGLADFAIHIALWERSENDDSGSRLELSTFRQLASLVRRLTSQSSFRLSMATDLFAWWSRDHDRQRWPARASRGSRLNSQMRE